ncbi:hypothetical protein EST38_g5682 [Candolleomyces aberdarensis]|uniref:HAM1-like N-terminal domain-containing protein n=1 Tax=Candolleomyces aberdarensis TaxID=2316362 RepID=A0A4Q2DLQ9_9AGAR|nr:hypothetical protein EST38_g5682 [Candolleomyces aberdarensis]
MDAIRNCFGGGRSRAHLLPVHDADADPSDTESDNAQDPLLPKRSGGSGGGSNRWLSHLESGVEHAATREPPPGRFNRKRGGRRGSGRVVDISSSESNGEGPHTNANQSGSNARGGHIDRNGGSNPYEHVDEKTAIDKLVDMFAALSKGKLPTQDQFTRMLQVLLSSDVLRTSPTTMAAAASIYGTGPNSRRGQKVIEDARNLVQAMLQFTMEKNDDNKFQDLICNLQFIEVPSEVPSVPRPPKPKVNVKVDVSGAAESSKDALHKGEQGVEEVRNQIPTSEELSNDLAILSHALRTLLTSLLTSSVFRFLLADILGIFRDVIAHGATDIEAAARGVEHAAESVEEKAKGVDTKQLVDEVFDGMKERKGKGVEGKPEMRDTSKGVMKKVSEGVKGLEDMTGEIVDEWREVGKDAKDTMKKDFVERMQQVLIQAQSDPASQNALRAILILVRKYADKISELGETVVETAEEVAGDVEDAALKGVPSASIHLEFQPESATRKGTDGRANGNAAAARPITTTDYVGPYPPPTTLYPPVPGGSKEGKGAGGDEPFKNVLLDLKAILERVGQNRSLDDLLVKFGNVVKDLDRLPVDIGKVVEEEAAKSLAEKQFDQDLEKSGDLGRKEDNAKWEAKAFDERGVEGTVTSSTSDASIETIRPSTSNRGAGAGEGGAGGKGGKKKKKKGKHSKAGSASADVEAIPVSIEVSRESETLQAEVEEESDSGEDVRRSGLDAPQESTRADEDKLPEGRQPNVIRVYFARLGRYLDRALEDPAWVTSKRGQGEMEKLFEDGVELVNVVGEVVTEATPESMVAEGIDALSTKAGRTEEEKEKGLKDETVELRRRFRTHAKEFLDELGTYVDAVERDRSTMKLVHAFEDLSSSVSDLFSGSPSSTPSSTSRKKRRATMLPRRILSTSIQWTEWLAWGLPKLMRVLGPLLVSHSHLIPIPSLEVKSESGGWEAGLYALFVKGNVMRDSRNISIARKLWDERRLLVDDDGIPPKGGVESTLVPDEVVVREWTEVRVDMAEYNESQLGSKHHHPPPVQSQPPEPRVETTSRVRIHIDGVRAKIEGLGYYFRYGGEDSWFGYEDEGVLNVDVGMGRGGTHGGFGCDVEIEINTGADRGRPHSRSNSTGQRRDHRRSRSPSPEVPLVGEGAEGEGEIASVPGFIVQDTDVDVDSQTKVSDDFTVGREGGEEEEDNDDEPANIDIQHALAPKDGSSAVGEERTRFTALSTSTPFTALSDQVNAKADSVDLDPLFQVVDVKIHLSGVDVQLEQSRHWILNKLFVQPLAGTTVSELVKYSLHQKAKDLLENLAVGLKRVSVDAEAHKQARREEKRRRRAKDRREWVGKVVREGWYDEDELRQLVQMIEEAEDGDDEDTFVGFLGDWLSAVIQSGPRILDGKRSAAAGEEDEPESRATTHSSVEATKRGIIYHQTTSPASPTKETPKTPLMVLNKRTGDLEAVPSPSASQSKEDQQEEREEGTSDLTVAVGVGAQLFSDRPVPYYGARNDQVDDLGTEGQNLLDEVRGAAVDVASEAIETSVKASTRWTQKTKDEEGGGGWYSGAFDL